MLIVNYMYLNKNVVCEEVLLSTLGKFCHFKAFCLGFFKTSKQKNEVENPNSHWEVRKLAIFVKKVLIFGHWSQKMTIWGSKNNFFVCLSLDSRSW